jgi:hypothetical protein
VRWEQLFDDLEGQVEAAEAAELDAELRDRARAERARLRTVDRLRGSLGRPIDVRLRGGERERGTLRRVGSDWLLLETPPGREALLPLGAVTVVGGLSHRSTEPGSEGPVLARLDLRHALRALTRDRSRVGLVLDRELRLSGFVERVGADHLELADAPGSTELQLIPLSALVVVRRVDAEL